MVIQQHKDIDATEAKVMYGLSLKKMACLAIAGGMSLVCFFMFHLPILVCGIVGGVILFLGTYKKQNMSAPVILIRVFQTMVARPTYCREKIASAHTMTVKQQEKAAVAWNRELLRQKKRHPEMVVIKTVRCTRNKKSRK